MWQGWFLMVPAVTKFWDGKATCWDEAGRVATIDVDLDGCKIRFGSVYMNVLTGADTQQARADTWTWVQRATKEFKEGATIFGGDWNSHMGRDGVQGRQREVGMGREGKEG